MNNNFDIAIVGAGPTGLILAKAMSSLGFSVVIFERNAKENLAKKDGRTFAISDKSKNILENFDLWQKLSRNAGQIKEIRVTDNYSPFFLHFDNKNLHGQPVSYMIESDECKSILLEEILALPNVTIIFNHKCDHLTQTTHYVEIDEIRAKYLFAADGKFSKIRSLIGIKNHILDYNQTAIVCNIKHQIPHDNIAQEMFIHSKQFAVLPMKDPHKSAIVWIEPHEVAKVLIKMEKQDLCYFLKERMISYLGEVSLINDPISYPLTASYSTDYFVGRVALIGDAAHSIHPLAGQGLNQGILDIEALYNIFKANNSNPLEIYEKFRLTDNMIMLFSTDLLNRLFTSNFSLLKLLRKVGLSLINKSDKLKDFLTSYAMGNKRIK